MSNSSTKSNKLHGKPCVKCGGFERYKSGQCAVCARKYQHEYRIVNYERVRGCINKWQKANSERVREASRKWQKANPGKTKEANHKWQKANLEKYREGIRKWRKANPEKLNAKNQRRRARMNGNVSEPYDFKSICDHYGNRCVRCGEKKPLSIDHIVPVSKGGPDIASNIQPLCKSCNSSKGVRHIDYRPDAGPLRWVQKELL